MMEFIEVKLISVHFGIFVKKLNSLCYNNRSFIVSMKYSGF